MSIDFNFVVRGEAGQGVQSVGFLLTKVFSRGGYHIFAEFIELTKQYGETEHDGEYTRPPHQVDFEAKERETRLELATTCLEGRDSTH